MPAIRDYSITAKLTWINMLVSATALLLACVAFAAYDLMTFRSDMVRRLSIQAQIVGSNSVSALLFNDPRSAGSTLSALKAAPHIVAAGIYTLAGQPFALYGRDHTGLTHPLPPIPGGQIEVHQFKGRQLTLTRSIVFQGKPVGLVLIRSDLEEMTNRLERYEAIAAMVLAASLLAALLVSSIFQRAFADRIVRLAETARIVYREKNYSVRAASTGSHDEIAILIEAFNEMLAQIQERDAALQKAQEQLNLALKSSGIGTWDWDIVTNKITWDEYTYPLFGLTPGTFLGPFEGFIHLVQPEDQERARKAVAKSLESDAPYDNEFHVMWPDGSIHVLSGRGKVYRDEHGKAVRMTGVCLDITERKRSEEQIRELNETLEHRVAERTAQLNAANKELEAFSYSASHDLRAPLRQIDGFSKILAEDYSPQLDSTAQSYLKRIQDGAQNMGQLMDALLEMGKVGRQNMIRQATDLNFLLQSVLKDIEPECTGRKIHWQAGTLSTLECDPALMKLVFANLLSNAVKYTRLREPAVIQIGQNIEDGIPIIFVRDNGAGFDKKYAHKLFGVFQRLHRNEEFEGTGVGLATVQRIIQRHGGRIWAEGELDKGATFFFTLSSRPADITLELQPNEVSYEPQ